MSWQNVEVTEEMANAVHRAVGFELTAQGLTDLGDEWVDFAQQFQEMADSIQERSLTLGVDEQTWDQTKQALLQERANSAPNWLQVDFFPEDKNSTTSTGSTASTASSIDTETQSQPALLIENWSLESQPGTEKEAEIEDVDEQENVNDDPLQQDLIQRAVPILFKALQRYGSVENQGQDIVLEGGQNSIRWSIPDRKLTVQGKETLEIEFDSDKQATNYESNLSPEYIEHLETKVASQLQAPEPSQIVSRNIDR